MQTESTKEVLVGVPVLAVACVLDSHNAKKRLSANLSNLSARNSARDRPVVKLKESIWGNKKLVPQNIHHLPFADGTLHLSNAFGMSIDLCKTGFALGCLSTRK